MTTTTTTTMTLFFKAITNLGWIHSWQGGAGDFYDVKTIRMTTMATTMRTILTRTYDDHNDDDDDGDERPHLFRQQPTLVGCIPGRGVVGDLYDDEEDEDDSDGDYNEEDHCPCLFQKVLPTQSTAIPTVRMTTTTSFYDMTQQPTHGQMHS